jgi:hypothetical protein
LQKREAMRVIRVSGDTTAHAVTLTKPKVDKKWPVWLSRKVEFDFCVIFDMNCKAIALGRLGKEVNFDV